MTDADDILNGGKQEQNPFEPKAGNNLQEDKLLAYLGGGLTPAERHEVEQWLTAEGAEGMEQDALEGLAAINAAEAKVSVSRLNQYLDRTVKGKTRKQKNAGTDATTVIAIAIILLLCIVTYLIIRMLLKS
ncbi:MAG: hypothetical protein H7257_14295 [Taibaiella sp.]|nr:hypothetical protein [Taibaiella sp.]